MVGNGTTWWTCPEGQKTATSKTSDTTSKATASHNRQEGIAFTILL